MMRTFIYDDIVPLDEIPQVRIIGGKHKMLNNISVTMEKAGITGNTLFDVFSGSSAVGRFFKRRFSITSNDMLFFSYALQRALICSNKYPEFKNLEMVFNLNDTNRERTGKVLGLLNKTEGIEGFIYKHYTPASKYSENFERKYFSEENGKKIDAIRTKINQWLQSNQITEDEYFYLIASLILAVQKISNISGTYGAYNKIWDSRSKKPLTLKIIEIIESKYSHRAFNLDSFKLLDKVKCDIAYIDPPYNSRQYVTNYHILETIAKYDNPHIYGKSGMRQYDDEKSTFCSKNAVKKEFPRLLSGLNTKYIVLSYNSEGLITKSEIEEIFQKCDIKNIRIFEFPYRRFKSNGNTHYKEIKEYIFTGEKS